MCGCLRVDFPKQVQQDDAPSFVHAHALRRQVIEEPFIGEWRAAAKFVFRWPGVA
jgi:hypothetical protein